MKRSTTVAGVRREPSVGAHSSALTHSQQRWLDRLHYLASCDSPLLCMSGSPGAGKTTLALQFLESADGVNAALVTLAGPINGDDLRRQLLWQLVGDHDLAAGETLVDLFDARGGDEQRLLLVIDGAQHLSSAQFDEIADLVRSSELHPGRRVALLVVDRDGAPAPEWLADPLITPMLIEALPAEERAALWRSRVGVAGESIGDRELLPWLERVAPTISHTLRLAEQGMVPGSRPGAVRVSRSVPLPVLAAAMAALLLALWWLWPQSSPTAPAVTELTLPVESAPPAAAAEAPAASPVAVAAVRPEPSELPPEQYTATTAAEARIRSALRVDIPGEQVDRALAADEAGLSAPAVAVVAEPLITADDGAEPSIIAADLAVTANGQADAPAAQAAPPVAPAATAPKTTPKPQPSEPFYRHSGSAYTLQFGAVRNLEALRRFAESQLGTELAPWAILEIQRDGQPLYLLIQGRYPTIDAAKAAIARLNAEQRANQPWPKALAVINQSRYREVVARP